jgi:hypothetical protein
LFRFWDGAHWRSVDPFATWRAIHCAPEISGGEFDKGAMFDAGEEPEATAYIEALARVFGVRRFCDDPHGLTDWEIIDVFDQFGRYLDGVKKNTSPLPSSPEPTAPASSSSLGPSTVNSSSSDSPLTPSESNNVAST